MQRTPRRLKRKLPAGHCSARCLSFRYRTTPCGRRIGRRDTPTRHGASRPTTHTISRLNLRLGWPVTIVTRQPVGQLHPWKLVFHPDVIDGRDALRFVEAAHGHVDVVGRIGGFAQVKWASRVRSFCSQCGTALTLRVPCPTSRTPRRRLAGNLCNDRARHPKSHRQFDRGSRRKDSHRSSSVTLACAVACGKTESPGEHRSPLHRRACGVSGH